MVERFQGGREEMVDVVDFSRLTTLEEVARLLKTAGEQRRTISSGTEKVQVGVTAEAILKSFDQWVGQMRLFADSRVRHTAEQLEDLADTVLSQQGITRQGGLRVTVGRIMLTITPDHIKESLEQKKDGLRQLEALMPGYGDRRLQNPFPNLK